MVVQPNKAVVGDNAFAHEAGIHQDGYLKERSTYEIMKPEAVGIPQSKLVLGKHSGRHAFRQRLKDLGYELTEDEMNKAFERFKHVADQKKYIFDEDIEALVSEEVSKVHQLYSLVDLSTSGGVNQKPMATVKLKIGDKVFDRMDHGDGPVDATYKAIASITGTKSNLMKFDVKGITGGTDALGEVTVTLDESGKTVRGHGADTNIIVAAAKAYVNALNKLAARKK
jgi:2-isopropylmalate synthase